MVGQELTAKGISLKGKNEAERDKVYQEQAWQVIKENPLRYMAVCLNRFGVIMLNIDLQGYSRLRGLAITLIQLALIILSLIAFIYYPGEWVFQSSPQLVFIAYNTLIYSLLLGSWRFNVPIMPYIMVWASLGLYRLCKPTQGYNERT